MSVYYIECDATLLWHIIVIIRCCILCYIDMVYYSLVQSSVVLTAGRPRLGKPAPHLLNSDTYTCYNL